MNLFVNELTNRGFEPKTVGEHIYEYGIKTMIVDEHRYEYAPKTITVYQFEIPELPELTGTAKQISWANEIRNNFIAGLNYAFSANAESVNDGSSKAIDSKRISEYYALTESILQGVHYSSWWIDRRNCDVESLLNVVTEKIVVYNRRKRTPEDQIDINGYIEMANDGRI